MIVKKYFSSFRLKEKYKHGECYKMAKPFSLVCYTVSDSESEEEEDVVDSAETAVSYVLDHILLRVTHGLRDFSDLYIKQEPDEVEEEWEAGQNYRESQHGTAVKLEDESEDEDSSADESLPDVAVNTEVDMQAENEGRICVCTVPII